MQDEAIIKLSLDFANPPDPCLSFAKKEHNNFINICQQRRDFFVMFLFRSISP